MFEAAEVSVAEDGRVLVRSSASPHGQGHATTFAQIVADRLGVEPEEVDLEFSDWRPCRPASGRSAAAR